MHHVSGFMAAALALGCSVLQAQDYIFPSQSDLTFEGGNFSTSQLAPAGDRIYAADGTLGVLIWDVASPDSIRPLGAYRAQEGFFPADLAVSGSILYVIDNSEYSRLRILDLADPLHPVEVGVLGGPDPEPQLNYPSRLEVSGQLCFLWQPFSDLSVVDVGNPAAPVLRGQTPLGEAFDVVAQGTRLFLAMGSEGLKIWDASDPSAVAEIGGLSMGEFEMAYGLAVVGPTAYVVSDQSIKIVDVSAPSAPILVGEIPEIWGVTQIRVSEGYLYAGGGPGLEVFDVTDPGQVTRVAQWSWPLEVAVECMATAGDRLILGAGSVGVVLVDIADPSAPRWLGDTRGLAGGQDYHGDGDLGLVVAGFGGLSTIEESESEWFYTAGHLPLEGYCGSVVRNGDLAYVAGGYGGLQVVNVADRFVPLSVGRLLTGGTPSDLAIALPRLYVADGEGGLGVYDVSVPGNPTRAGGLSLEGFARRLLLDNPVIYVATDLRQVHIVNVANAANPAKVSTLGTQGEVGQILVHEGTLYLAEGLAGVEMFDVRTVSSPQLLGRLNFGEPVLGIGMAQGYLLVALAENRMVLVDVAEPGRPVKRVDEEVFFPVGRLFSRSNQLVALGEFQASYFRVEPNPAFVVRSHYPGHPGGFPWKLKVSGNRLYVAAGDSLLAYDIGVRAEPRFLGFYTPEDYVPLRDLEVRGDVVFAGADQALVTVDFAWADLPAELDRLGMPGPLAGVQLDGDWALVGGAAGQGLRIVDASDPSHLGLLGIYISPNINGESAARKGDVIFAEAFGGRIEVVDATDPAQPNLVVSFNTGAVDFADFEVVGDWLYAAGDGYKVVNVGNPAAPGFPAELGEPMQFTSDMHALPDYLYFADANLGLMIVDVSSPLAPVTASITATGLTSPFGVQVAGDTAYMLDDQGLHVIDVTDRGDPTELERIPMSVNLTVLDVRGDLVVGGGGPVDELLTVSVSDPGHPRLLARTLLDASVFDVQVVGDFAYLANGWRGLAVWDVTDPAQPFEVSQGTVPAAEAIEVRGDVAYLAMGDQGLAVVDVRDAAAPSLVATHTTSASANGLWVEDGRAYVMSLDGTLEIVDITAPAQPVRLGSWTTFVGPIRAVAVRGDVVYVGSAATILALDITDPGNPVEMGPVAYLGYEVQGMVLEGDQLVVATGYGGEFAEASEVVLVDLLRQDPFGSTLTLPYRLVGGTTGLAVRGNRVYVARGQHGLTVLERVASEPTGPALSLTRIGGEVLLDWPIDVPGFSLQAAPALPSGPWEFVPNGDTPPVTLPISPQGARFYRLYRE